MNTVEIVLLAILIVLIWIANTQGAMYRMMKAEFEKNRNISS